MDPLRQQKLYQSPYKNNDRSYQSPIHNRPVEREPPHEKKSEGYPAGLQPSENGTSNTQFAKVIVKETLQDMK